MSLISSGLAWLQSQLAQNAGSAIVYHSGPHEIEIPDAVLGKSMYESQDAAGVTVRSGAADWLIAPGRLTVDGSSIEPQPGDKIVHTLGSTVRTYLVVPLGNEPCWRWSGPSHDRMRIHVQEIAGS